MRALSSELQFAQKATPATPYIAIHCCKEPDGSPQYSYTTQDNVLKLIDHIEEPYNSTATIVLSNPNHDLPNLMGYRVTIAYGYGYYPETTYPGALYYEPWTWIGAKPTSGDMLASPTAPVWVYRQTQISKPGDCDLVLQCIGAWNMLFMMEDIASLLGATSPYYEVEYPEDTTIHDIIGNILNAAGFSLEALGIHDDGIVNTLLPDFTVNSIPFENAATTIYRLLNMTKGFLRVEPYPADEWLGKLVYVEKWSWRDGVMPTYNLVYTEPWTWLDGVMPDYGLVYTEPWGS